MITKNVFLVNKRVQHLLPGNRLSSDVKIIWVLSNKNLERPYDNDDEKIIKLLTIEVFNFSTNKKKLLNSTNLFNYFLYLSTDLLCIFDAHLNCFLINVQRKVKNFKIVSQLSSRVRLKYFSGGFVEVYESYLILIIISLSMCVKVIDKKRGHSWL